MRPLRTILSAFLFTVGCAGPQAPPPDPGPPMVRAVAVCEGLEVCRMECESRGIGAACYELGIRQLTEEMMKREAEGGGDASAQNIYEAAQAEAPRASFALAVEELSKECGRGEALSCFYLGRLDSEGWGVPLNQPLAMRRLLKACDGGVADACTRVGWMFFEGLAVAKDQARGLELLERGCAGNHPVACQTLGDAYLQGTGVEADQERGRALLKKACDGGAQDACAPAGSPGS